MKSARDVAIDTAQRAFGLDVWSRETFLVMLADKCDQGATLRRMVGAIESAIELDRKMTASLGAPS